MTVCNPSQCPSVSREQIAALKALGFPTVPLMLHYLKLVAVIVLIAVFLLLRAVPSAAR